MTQCGRLRPVSRWLVRASRIALAVASLVVASLAAALLAVALLAVALLAAAFYHHVPRILLTC